MKKYYHDFEVLAARWFDKKGVAHWGVEVQVNHEEYGKPTYLRADRLVSGKNFRNIGRIIMEAAGYDVPRTYKELIAREWVCGNFIDYPTKREALAELRKTWTAWDGSKPDIRIVELPLGA
ncbi:MAG: hypothetical protein FWE04_01600 [Oscillospiraceae bacterium]|nr:hypothetical protein [Oscillospiraceae bacterium]